MSGYDLAAVKAARSIVEVVGAAVQLKKNGKGMVGLCPFHPDRTPSLHVYEDRYYCYACSEGGDVIDFVQKMKGCDLATAVSMLVGGGGAIDTSPEAKAEIARMAAERDKLAAAERQNAISRAKRIWDEAEDSMPDPHHPYLVRKQIEAIGARQAKDGRLLLPVYGPDSEIMSVQHISDNGTKMFLAGAPTKGGWMPIGVDFKKLVIVCEGFATGSTLFASTLYHVRVAFSLGNMEHVARGLVANGTAIILAADTGKSAEQMIKLGRELKCPVVIPRDNIILDGGEVGSDFNDQAQAFGSESVADDVRAVVDAFVLAQTRRNEEQKAENSPIDLWAKPTVPEMPLGLLPTIIERLAVERSVQLGTEPGGLAIAALTACASLISDEISIKPKLHEKWTEQARIWGMLVGLPSAKKSPIMKAAANYIRGRDLAMLNENNRKLAEWQADGGSKGSEPKPPCPRLRIEDVTTEHAQDVCKDSPNGVLDYEDELSGWFARIEKYGSKGNSDASFWLKAYGGGQYAVGRVGRGAFVIENLSITVLGAIQPDTIKRIMADSVDNGLIQRFIPVLLNPAEEDKDIPAPPVQEDYEDMLGSLMNLKAPTNFFGAQPVTFDDEAQEIRKALVTKHYRMNRALEEHNPKLASAIGKYDGLFPRLCLIWHCIEHVSSGGAADSLPTVITGDTASRVADFIHGFILQHTQAFYAGLNGLTSDFEKVQAVGGYILAHKLDTVTMRTIGRNVRAMRNVTRDDASRVFEQLEAMGWLEQANKRSDAPSWNVVPEVHAMFEAKAESERERREMVRETIAEIANEVRDERRQKFIEREAR